MLRMDDLQLQRCRCEIYILNTQLTLRINFTRRPAYISFRKTGTKTAEPRIQDKPRFTSDGSDLLIDDLQLLTHSETKFGIVLSKYSRRTLNAHADNTDIIDLL
jgi:hypothetical protein